MNYFLNFLEKCSVWLDKISKPMEAKVSYFICMAQIVVCFLAMGAAAGFFAYIFPRQTAFDVRLVLIVFLVVILLILGPYTYLLITRDLKQIRDRCKKIKEDTAKMRKIEF